MATLRQTEIDEILNHDRTMNRRVLDRTIAQVQSFNDERSAPNVQDIKYEAIMGSLVDKLKASIAEALKLVAAKQFPQVTSSNAAIILNVNTGKYGMTADNPNQEALEELDDNQGTYAVKPNAGTLDGKGKSFEEAIIKGKEKDIKDNIDNNQGYRITGSLPNSYQKRISDDLEWLESNENSEDEQSVEGGYCGMGYGIRRKKKRITGGANDKPTMKNATTKISINQNTNTIENALYDIINQYNGIVDKILEATREGGVTKNKRLASASISSFFANMLQGLIEPLKHLLYELALVRDKDTASMWTMMKSMVDNIQSAPPFQKVDFRIYKTPATDYQRLNRDLRIDDYDGKIALMKKDADKLQKSLKRLHQDASHIEYAMEDKTPEYKREMKDCLLKKQKEIMDAIKKQQEDMDYVEKRKKSGLPYDSKALEDSTKEIIMRGKVMPLVSSVMSGVAVKLMNSDQIQELIESQNEKITELTKQAETLQTKSQSEVLTESDVELLKSLTETAEQIREHNKFINKQLGLKKRTEEIDRRFNNQLGKQNAALGMVDKILGTTFNNVQKTKEQIAAEYDDEVAEGNEPEEREPGVGKVGFGKPLADLLAKPKQQHNTMGRPLSNDDKIHKEVIKLNQKWQVSNPIHTTPIGSKNPFYAQQPDAKYDFRTILGKENSVLYPKKNALGADVSLLQGDIGGPTEEAKQKRKYRKAEVETRTEAEALRNILNQNVYKGGSKKQPGALRKLVFDDDDNDLFDEEELPVNKGFIKEDKDDKFKLPDIKKEQAKKNRGRL